MAITAHGKIHGCTIQLDSELGIPDGAEFESIFEQIAKDRESATFRESDS